MTYSDRIRLPYRAALRIAASMILACGLLFAAAWDRAGLAQSAPPVAPIETQPGAMANDKALVERVERYLNSIESLKSDFLQISPSGSFARGTVYLHRPSRLRIDYEPPTPVLIVANGYWLIYYDTDLKEASYTPLDDSLAGFLVRETIELTDGDVRVTRIAREKGIIRIEIVQRDDPEGGRLSLVFSDDPLILRQWSVVDGDGNETRVTLDDPTFDARIDPKVFEFTPPEHEWDND